MDNIKKYFSLSDDVNDKLVDENVKTRKGEFNVNGIFNEVHRQDEIATKLRFDSVNETTRIRDSNQHFIRRIQSLEEENDRLSSIVENNKTVIKDGLKCNNCKNGTDYAARKISQLMENIKELKSELQTMKSSEYGDSENNAQGDNDSIKIKQLMDELNVSIKKNCSYRNEILQLKNNLQIVQNKYWSKSFNFRINGFRWLERSIFEILNSLSKYGKKLPIEQETALLNEVGNPAVMRAVLSDTGSPNSTGRAQQILLLSQKVKELEAKLNGSNNESESCSRVSIRKMEKARDVDQSLRDAQLKICKLNALLDKLKCQRDASELGINALRMQKQELLSKSEVDKHIIDTIKTELDANNIKLSKAKVSVLRLEESVKSQKLELEKARQTIERQTSDLNDKDETIVNLKSKVLNYEETISNRNTCKMNFSDPRDVFKKKLDDFENQQLKEILCLAHDHICAQVLHFKDKSIIHKPNSQTNKSKVSHPSSFISSAHKSNNTLCKWKTESNEKLIELQYKLEQAEEECAVLKDKLDILTSFLKKHVQQFKETLQKQHDDAVNKLNEMLD